MTRAHAFICLLFVAVSSAQPVKSPKSECEDLLGAALPFAVQMLESHGEFLPYGYATKPDGEYVAVGATDGREQPPSRDLIALLREAFRKSGDAGRYQATALVYDVRVSNPNTREKTDAIAVSLNHVDKYAVLVFIPYKLLGGKVVEGEAFAQDEENYAFITAK